MRPQAVEGFRKSMRRQRDAFTQHREPTAAQHDEWQRQLRLGTDLLERDVQAPAAERPEGETSPGRGPLLGPDASHGFRDVLLRHLDRHPAELERLRTERPEGPLAVSHRVRAQPVRSDHIWATGDLEVLDVRYLYDEAVAAGSDHALVLADLKA